MIMLFLTRKEKKRNEKKRKKKTSFILLFYSWFKDGLPSKKIKGESFVRLKAFSFLFALKSLR